MSESLPTVDFVVSANSFGSNLRIGKAMRKACTCIDLQIDFDDPIVDINGQKLILEVPKASYKSTLLEASSEKKQDDFQEEEFSLLEGDAQSLK